MTVSKRASLGISLGAIVLYSIYQIVVAQRRDAPLPAHFSDLVWLILRTKIIVLTALFLLLRLEREGFKALGLSAREWPEDQHGDRIFTGDSLSVTASRVTYASDQKQSERRRGLSGSVLESCSIILGRPFRARCRLPQQQNRQRRKRGRSG